MFLTNSRSGYRVRDGEQFAHGKFLILMSPPDGVDRTKVRAIVRHVRMWQSGPYMVAFIRVKGHKVYLSGAYGSNGLLTDVPKEVYDIGEDLPPELYEKWSKGGGWNSTGSEAPDMRKWAQETFKV